MSLTVSYEPIDEIQIYENNSRTHSEKQIEQISASIQEFGFVNPLLVDENLQIIAGHGRLMAADSMGLDTVPVIKLAGLTETQKRAYVIADNKLALNAGWDFDLLSSEIEQLKEVEFDIFKIGFSEKEMDDIMGNFTEKPFDDFANVSEAKLSHECPKCGFEFD